MKKERLEAVALDILEKICNPVYEKASLEVIIKYFTNTHVFKHLFLNETSTLIKGPFDEN